MPEIYVEPIATSEPAESVHPRRHSLSRWLKRIVFVLIALWITAQGLSLAIQHTGLRRIITTHVELAIGRRVEIGTYHFRFWRGPVIEAHSVIVREDPRFGAEYFLRADSMIVHLRWRSLLRGHAEVDAISLDHPSLNLVRDSDGQWNFAEWLPRPSTPSASPIFSGPIAPSPNPSIHRIDITGGRINFKVLEEKLPFAFVDVSGSLEADGTGRWHIDLQATPWRAAVVLQHAGVVQVAGKIGGTSSRLRPAAIHVNWTDASLPDVLRLVRDNDFGVRGSFSVWLDATTDSEIEGWTLKSRAQLQQIHSWDLAVRPDNPALNVIADALWHPSSPFLELTRATIESPHSNLAARGRIYWNRASPPHSRPAAPAPTLTSSAEIDARDILAWTHAFRLGIADDLSAGGLTHVDAALSLWPLQVSHAELSSDGVDLSGAGLMKTAHIGRLQALFAGDRATSDSHGLTSLGPVTVSWGTATHPEGSLRFERVASLAPTAPVVWRLSGSTLQVRDWITGANEFGWNMPRGWDVTGPFSFDIQLPQSRGERLDNILRRMSGWMQLGGAEKEPRGAVLRVPFLNLPITEINARVDLKPDLRRARVTSAEAFGARWSGTLERPDRLMPWQFDLTADQLSATDFDRWLNPRWRESFLDRVLPFLNSRAQMTVAPDNLQANGRLKVRQFTLTRIVMSDLEGDLALHGRRIAIANGLAQFYGGKLSGSFDANLEPVPSYRAILNFSRIRASQLISLAPALAGFIAQSADGQISLSATGADPSELISSLTCEGSAQATGPELLRYDLAKTLGRGSLDNSSTRFLEGSADFSCGRGDIELQRVRLVQDGGLNISGSGSIDFRGSLDFRLKADPDFPAPEEKPVPDFRLTGTFAAPQVSAVFTAERRPR